MSYIDVTGKNETEAIEKALLQLGLSRDDVSVEVLERARSGFLGIGASPAKVRVSYGESDSSVSDAAEEAHRAALFAPEKIADKKAAKPEEKKKKAVAAPKVAEIDKEALRRELAEKKEILQKSSEVKAESEQSESSEKSESRENSVKAEKSERRRSRSRSKSAKTEKAPAEKQPTVYEGVEAAEDDRKAQEIRAFISGLLEHMDCRAEMRIFELEKGQYRVYLEGEKMGSLIGRRGETLDAIQQLTNYSISRSSEKQRIRVQVDAENYRAKREESLANLANKMAGKVVKYGRSMTLEPMNAYERHVIHTALQEHPKVTTYSTGTEPNRRVVVAIDRTKAQ